MFCPHCGVKCDENHLFCYRCGEPLPQLPQEPAPEPVEEVVPQPGSEAVSMPVAEADPLPMEESAPLPVEESAPLPVAQRSPEVETTEPEATVPAPEPVQPEAPRPAPRKGRLWPPLVIMAVMICIGLAAYFISNYQAPPENKSETPWFTVENGVLDFHQEYYFGDAELTIPSVVDGQTVTAIADHAFSGCNLISTVILPDTVIRIGDYAFSSCHKLRGIYIPSSVDVIGVYVFADCDSLEAIYLPGGLTKMGHGALDSCDNLRFILFNGTYAQWNELYEGYFVSEVELHTTDGTYYAKP